MSVIRTFNVEAGMPTLDQARRLVIEEIKRAKRERVKVLIGGAPVTQNYANEIGADGYGESATSAVSLARQLVAEGVAG